MKTDKNKINKIIDLGENSPLPRPISPRECKCGCGYTFQPGRIDQVYLNKQHANFGYNHNTRKTKHSNRKKVEKMLCNNDSILEKYFKAHRQENCATCFLDALKADGFDLSYFTGTDERDGKKYFCVYNYKFRLYVSDKIKLIEISK
ncbi:MAG: hypothetical protein K9I95_05850 [Flavobacteriaceae bacterium]|nr:hypothetical protein [Flavobacteriaceae bacterium]